MTSPTEPRTQAERLEVVIEALRQFHNLRVDGDLASCGEMLEFDYPEYSVDLAYGWQEPDFTRELVNSHNHFVLWLNRLAAWERIIGGYSEDDAYSLTFEFVEMPLDYCLHFPYRFKQRITFCATQLCYVAGIHARLLAGGAIDNDQNVQLASLKTVAGHWQAGPPLVEAIERLDGEGFRRATGNYRNKAQHRFPPRLAFGEVTYVERSFPAGHIVSYSMNVAHPIRVGDVLPALAEEAAFARAAFLAYRGLVDEQQGASTRSP